MLSYKTWIELDAQALRHNVAVFRKLLSPKTKLWAVVKSNAYGHGLLDFSKLANKFGVDGFCVDSIPEAVKLRQADIKKPILVLGPTMNGDFIDEAYKNKITLTISNENALENLLRHKNIPEFHIKVDTGMHRQGFFLNELKRIINSIENWKLEIRNCLKGIYTHFAAAKDIKNQKFTRQQFNIFQKAIIFFEARGYKNLIKHTAATGGTLLDKRYHLDAVRVGAGLYGIYPSAELERQLGITSKIKDKIILKPVLSWHSLISEIKQLKKGDYIGYDLTEKIVKPTDMAVVPIGYWHGFDRGLSKIGAVLIKGRRARVLGRVSMDLIAVDVTGINCAVGDSVAIINNELTAVQFGKKINTSAYEVLTRINPLIQKILKTN